MSLMKGNEKQITDESEENQEEWLINETSILENNEKSLGQETNKIVKILMKKETADNNSQDNGCPEQSNEIVCDSPSNLEVNSEEDKENEKDNKFKSLQITCSYTNNYCKEDKSTSTNKEIETETLKTLEIDSRFCLEEKDINKIIDKPTTNDINYDKITNYFDKMISSLEINNDDTKMEVDHSQIPLKLSVTSIENHQCVDSVDERQTASECETQDLCNRIPDDECHFNINNDGIYKSEKFYEKCKSTIPKKLALANNNVNLCFNEKSCEESRSSILQEIVISWNGTEESVKLLNNNDELRLNEKSYDDCRSTILKEVVTVRNDAEDSFKLRNNNDELRLNEKWYDDCRSTILKEVVTARNDAEDSFKLRSNNDELCFNGKSYDEYRLTILKEITISRKDNQTSTELLIRNKELNMDDKSYNDYRLTIMKDIITSRKDAQESVKLFRKIGFVSRRAASHPRNGFVAMQQILLDNLLLKIEETNECVAHIVKNVNVKF